MSRSMTHTWLAACGLLLILLACGLPTPAPAPQPFPEQFNTNSTPQLLEGTPRRLPAVEIAPFAPYTTLTSNELIGQPIYQPTLTAVSNPAALPLLTDEERAQLEQNGFLMHTTTSADPWAPLNRAFAAGEPVFISSDLVLLATAAVHQHSWQQAQNQYLYSQLQAFSLDMADRMQRRWEISMADLDAAAAESDTSVLEATVGAAWRNWAYFSTAAKLLDPSYTPDPLVAEMVESELALTEVGGEFVSPLLGDVVNYSSFQTADSEYEQALRWYKQMGISLDAVSTDVFTHGYQVRLLLEEINPAWEGLFTTHTFFAGNRASPLTQWAAIAALTTDDPIDILILTANELPLPIFYLLPPPQAADSPILNGLTYNRVGTYTGATSSKLPPTAAETAVGPVRLYPSPLDLPAVMGSAEALASLEATGDTAYTGFEGQFAGLRSRYVNLNSETSYGEGWFYALQPLLTPTSGQRPLYAQSAAWHTHQLQIWQSGWLLNRVNIATPDQRPEYEPFPRAPLVIEPQPELYGRLAAQTRQLLTGLGERGLLSQPNADELLALETLLYQLQALSRKQAAGLALTEQEQQWLNVLPNTLHSWTAHITLPQTSILSTNPATNEQMTISIAGAKPLYVLTLVEGRLAIATGMTFDFAATQP